MLGLRDGSCANDSPIEVQDCKNTNSDHQKFFLTDDGRLKNKGCSNNRLLTNKWDGSCRHGNELVIKDELVKDEFVWVSQYSSTIS